MGTIIVTFIFYFIKTDHVIVAEFWARFSVLWKVWDFGHSSEFSVFSRSLEIDR